MLKETDLSNALKKFFKKNKLVRLPDLFNFLNTKSRMSVLRQLKKIQYLSSYTHAGSYYTLKNIPNFELSDIWHFNQIGFSKFGNLKKTVLNFIEHSECGYTHEELERKILVRVHNTLLDLVNSKKIERDKFDGEYVYYSIRASQLKKQLSNRKNYSQALRDSGLSDWLIIEILSSIVRTNKNVCIEPSDIILDLSSSRNIIVTEIQIDQVLAKFDLKKTLEFL